MSRLKLSIGDLNSRVTIQSPDTGVDAAGQPTSGWTDVVTGVAANVRYLSGMETIKAGGEISVARASIVIRRRSDVTASMRILLGDTVFQVKTVLPDEEDRTFMSLVCEVLS